MRRFGAVLHIFSLVMLLFGLTMLVPLGLSSWLRDGAELAYDEASVASMATGGLVWGLTRRFRGEAQPWDSFLLLVLNTAFWKA